MDDVKHLQRNSWPVGINRVFIPKPNSRVLLRLLLSDKPTLPFLCNNPIHKELVGLVAEEWTEELPQWAFRPPTEPQREDHGVPAATGTGKGTREDSETSLRRGRLSHKAKGRSCGLEEDVRSGAYSKEKIKLVP